MLKNVIVYSEIHGICANICGFLHMRHNFCICDSENSIICGKICDMRVLAKYAIAYSHITGISDCTPNSCIVNLLQLLGFGALLGTNSIHDFTAVTFSVKLAFFHEKRRFP